MEVCAWLPTCQVSKRSEPLSSKRIHTGSTRQQTKINIISIKRNEVDIPVYCVL